MSSSRSGLLSVAHGGTCVVVFIEDGSGLLRDSQVPWDALYEKDHLSGVVGGHKLGFGRRSCNRRLEFAFICDGASSKSKNNASKRTACLHTGSPVRIRLGMHNISVMFWSGHVEEEVLFVAIDSREGSFFEFRPRGSTPVIEALIVSSIKILKSMFDPVVVMFMRTSVCLWEFNASLCQIRTSSCHCPDEFTNSTSVSQLHRFGEFLLDVRVGVANGCIELLKPGGIKR